MLNERNREVLFRDVIKNETNTYDGIDYIPGY